MSLTLVAVAPWPLRLDGFWPWTLPDIGSAAVAVWLVTFASGSWWCLREGDWHAYGSSSRRTSHSSR